jgi:hypothetical protein
MCSTTTYPNVCPFRVRGAWGCESAWGVLVKGLYVIQAGFACLCQKGCGLSGGCKRYVGRGREQAAEGAASSLSLPLSLCAPATGREQRAESEA